MHRAINVLEVCRTAQMNFDSVLTGNKFRKSKEYIVFVSIKDLAHPSSKNIIIYLFMVKSIFNKSCAATT